LHWWLRKFSIHDLLLVKRVLTLETQIMWKFCMQGVVSSKERWDKSLLTIVWWVNNKASHPSLAHEEASITINERLWSNEVINVGNALLPLKW
jgi:hypothetical protein